jgi:hypothetical protein
MTSPGPSNSFAIIPVYGPPPDSAIMHGSWNACMTQVPDSRARNDAIEEAYRAVADAVEAEERRDAALQSAREADIRRFCDGIATLGKRLDTLETKRRDKARQDAEEEQRQIQAMLDRLPDPDDPDDPMLEMEMDETEIQTPVAVSLNEE